MRTAGLLVTVACACLLAAACSSGTTSSAAAATHYTYARHYVSGEVTRYTYTEQQAGAAGKLTAVAQLTAYARDGVGGEQVKWITLTDPEGHNLDAQARAFPPYDLSLDSSAPDALALPKGVSGELQGPVDDLLTFYVDLSSKAGIGYLHEPGDSHVDSKPLTGNFATASTPVGQDFIQLTTTLTRLTAQQATFRSSYQPPPSGGLKLYRPFMSSPACHGAPNNFELVQKSGSGYAVLWGCESFVVTTVVERATGQIISVRMTNPLMLKGKMCLEVALTKCGNIPATQEERIVMLTRSAA